MPVAGYAVYFEFHGTQGGKEQDVAQFLIISPTVGPNRQQVPYVMWSRKITPEHPQSPWTPDFLEQNDKIKVNLDGVFTRTSSIEAGLTLGNELFEQVAGAIETTAAYNFKFYGTPIIVEVSEIDARELSQYRRPKFLFDRVMQSRDGMAFSPLPTGAPKGGAK